MPNALKGIKRIYNATKSGLDDKMIVHAFTEMDKNINHFLVTVKKEDSSAQRVFIAYAQALFMLDDRINSHKTWNSFFDILKDSIKYTQTTLEETHNPAEDKTSLERIDSEISLFKNWYEKLDPRLFPLLDFPERVKNTRSDLIICSNKRGLPTDIAGHVLETLTREIDNKVQAATLLPPSP